ncbi:MAG TPA: hypothetical protein VGY48_10335 [Vicinamibacterales bacterium]|jgi:hypothetical protein|nr:hypothetical protein [Vicinamibacterales bacterium]
MKYSVFGVCLAALLAATTACSDNPAQPSSGSSSSLTASIAAPRPVSPANAALIKNSDQPATLVVLNAYSTQGSVATQSGATYTFEVATDAAFGAKVQTKDAVAEGTGGQTVVKLDALTPARDYYWHARATSGGTTGLFGPVSKFSIGAAISIDPPVPVGPLSGATSSGWPAFTVTNSTRSGPVGALVYRFEISANASFSTLLASGTVNETPNRTSFIPPSSPAPSAQTTLFWRATAIDQSNNVSSPASTAQSFTYALPTRQALLAAQEGFVLWSGVQPPGTTGQATMGANWDVQTVTSFTGVTHVVPTQEELRVFDLIDRGMDPGAALNWMNSNGYGTTAIWVPSVQVVGFTYEYIALIYGQWQMVIRAGG